jgi:phage head maturation protease
LELFEISLVSVPANPFALVKSFDSCFKAEEDEETAEEPKEEEAVEEKEEYLPEESEE